jgi:hypothetical protein
MAETPQFYIGNVRTDDVKRCQESRAGRYPIIVTGKTEAGEVETFTGIVQSVEYLRHNPADLSWSITLEDAD